MLTTASASDNSRDSDPVAALTEERQIAQQMPPTGRGEDDTTAGSMRPPTRGGSRWRD